MGAQTFLIIITAPAAERRNRNQKRKRTASIIVMLLYRCLYTITEYKTRRKQILQGTL